MVLRLIHGKSLIDGWLVFSACLSDLYDLSIISMIWEKYVANQETAIAFFFTKIGVATYKHMPIHSKPYPC